MHRYDLCAVFYLCTCMKVWILARSWIVCTCSNSNEMTVIGGWARASCWMEGLICKYLNDHHQRMLRCIQLCTFVRNNVLITLIPFPKIIFPFLGNNYFTNVCKYLLSTKEVPIQSYYYIQLNGKKEAPESSIVALLAFSSASSAKHYYF